MHEIRNYPYPQLHLLALQSLNPSRHATAVRESYEVNMFQNTFHVICTFHPPRYETQEAVVTWTYCPVLDLKTNLPQVLCSRYWSFLQITGFSRLLLCCTLCIFSSVCPCLLQELLQLEDRLGSVSRGAVQTTIERFTFPHKYKKVAQRLPDVSNIHKLLKILLLGFIDFMFVSF